MRNAFMSGVRTVGVLAAGLLGAAAPAQGPLPVSDQPRYPIVSQVTPSPDVARPPAGVGRIEIYEGPRRTVHYVAPNLSPSEQAALNDLARAENETAYANELLALKRLYVDSERTLEPYRRFIQQQLYGFSTDSTSSGFVSSGFGGFGGGGFFPYVFGDNAYGNGWGNGWGGSLFGGTTTTTSRSLANGMGDEGVMKAAFARQIASQASPEFAADAARGMGVAMGRVAASEPLAKSFGLNRGNIAPAAAATAPRIVLTLKNGEKVDGTLYGEDADWFRVDTATGTVSVRKSEVSKVEMPKK
jgi:hypothetical protein